MMILTTTPAFELAVLSRGGAGWTVIAYGPNQPSFYRIRAERSDVILTEGLDELVSIGPDQAAVTVRGC